MTGELFSLLRKHSILADLLTGEVEPDEAFAQGVRHALDHDDLTSDLFAVRARVLLGESPRQNAASYTSGLLIGADVRIGLKDRKGSRVDVMGRSELTRLYAAAIREAGGEPNELDGEQSFLSGIRAIAKRI